MSAKRRSASGKQQRRRQSRGGIGVRGVPGTSEFELVYPRCVGQREEDMEQVRTMLAAGEIDIAVDELRWLLEDCRELLEAHKLLGEIALSDGDWPLARAHFGYAYDMGCKAIPEVGLAGPLACTREANRPFFEAGKGLASCLVALGGKDLAAAIVEQLLELDPSDPLGIREVLCGDERGG